MVKRYLATFRNTLLNLVINFITFSILPKSISLSDYGLYQFTSSFFTNLRSLLNFASSGAIFQLSSKHRDSRAILNLYIIFLSIQLISIVSIISLIYISDFTEMVFNSKDIWLISYIAIVEFINFIFTFLLSYGDAKGLTLIFQRVKTYELCGERLPNYWSIALGILTLYRVLKLSPFLLVVFQLGSLGSGLDLATLLFGRGLGYIGQLLGIHPLKHVGFPSIWRFS